jgi:hypothetical protein
VIEGRFPNLESLDEAAYAVSNSLSAMNSQGRRPFALIILGARFVKEAGAMCAGRWSTEKRASHEQWRRQSQVFSCRSLQACETDHACEPGPSTRCHELVSESPPGAFAASCSPELDTDMSKRARRFPAKIRPARRTSSRMERSDGTTSRKAISWWGFHRFRPRVSPPPRRDAAPRPIGGNHRAIDQFGMLTCSGFSTTKLTKLPSGEDRTLTRSRPILLLQPEAGSISRNEKY